MEERYKPVEVEERIIKAWEKSELYKFDLKSKSKVYSIDTPPPTVSGDIHVGHIFSYSQADFVARYKRMRGYNVFYPFGLDNNGLPTELLIEKKFNTTAEILGRDKFVELTRKEIQPYNDKYVALWKRLGLSVDWSLFYQTISEEVEKVSQTSFLDLVAADRAYREEAPLIFCPKCKTAISQMELKDKMMKSKIYKLRFAPDVEIATTRPELLPACVAIFVNDKDAAKKKLVGKRVKVPIFGTEVEVIANNKVDPNFGTGVVMCCTFGDQVDIDWYKQYRLPLKIIINEKGKMSIPYYGNIGIKQAREKIVEDLKEKNFITDEKEIEHNVNVHERCGTEIEFIVKKQWYIKYLDLREKFLEFGNKVNWYPEFMKTRYENWVNGLHWNWGISRQRYFGIYFPVWYCKECSEPMFAEKSELPVNPFVDKPKRKCECGSSEFLPETDIMDTWFTSSLTPLINSRWGLDEKYLEKIYPMQLRPQGYEIISFWAFTTIVKSYLHTKSIPWHDIMISGMALDSKGQAMHKSLGNVTYPEPIIEKYGADSIRYWASSGSLGEDNNYQEKEVVSGAKLVNKLFNLSRFISMTSKEFKKEESKNVLDMWIIAKLNETIADATAKFDKYNYFLAKRAVEEFFWVFANDYLEFVKNRVYAEDNAAKYTVNEVFLDVVKMFSPFIPFCTEEIYWSTFKSNKALSHKTDNAASVHVSRWPEAAKQDKRALDEGEKLANVIRTIRKWKSENRHALNSEISRVVLGKDLEGLKPYAAEISTSMNVKKVEFGNVAGKIDEMSIEISK